MAKIWKGHRGGSTWGYNIECLEEEAAAELGQPKTYAAKLGNSKASAAEIGEFDASAAELGELKPSTAELGEPKPSAAEFGQLKTSATEHGQLKPSAAEHGQLKASAAEFGELKTSAAEIGQLKPSEAELGQLKTSAAEFGELKNSGTSLSSSFGPHCCNSQIEEDEDLDQPLDLSSSKSNTTWLYSQEEDGGEGSDERDSNTSSSNESPLSERSFSPEEVQESPRRGPRLTRDERWMVDQGITEHISLAEVIESDMTELKQRVEGLVQQNRLTETQASELMHIRKRGKNKNAAKNSRKKKDAEIDELKKAVKEAERKQKPVVKEQRDLLLEKSFWEDKLATLTHFLLISHRMDPDEYQVVVDKGEVLFSLRDAVVGHGIMEEEVVVD